MSRRPSETLTPREAQVMGLLWAAGKATAEDLRQALPDHPHDSTVRTILRVLIGKGYVKRASGQNTIIYRPAVARAKVERKALRSFLQRFFGGSAHALLVRLVEDERITPEQVERLRRRYQPGRKEQP